MWNTNQISTSIVIDILINISETGRMKKNIIRHAYDAMLLRYIIISYLRTYTCEVEGITLFYGDLLKKQVLSMFNLNITL